MSDNVRCSCKHEFQDSKYGKGIRATTPMKNGQLRCTVCGMVHGSQSVATTVKAKDPVVKAATKAPDMKSKVTDKVLEKKPEEKKKSLKGGKR